MSKYSPQKKKGGGQALWWVAGVAVLAVAVLISISAINSRNKAKADESASSDAQVHAVRTLKGPENAKVKLVEFSDFG